MGQTRLPRNEAPLQTGDFDAATESRCNLLETYELEAEVAQAIDDTIELSLVGDRADEGGLARRSLLEHHARERRGEPLAQPPSHGDSVSRRRHGAAASAY